MEPVFSIVIPTYNRATVIGRTLDSVLAQTYQDWECLIVDDFSTDDTKDVVENYCYRDCRFRYFINERKKGAQGARNTGLFHAQSDWLCFFDSDDYMSPEFLEKMNRKIGDGHSVYTCYTAKINVSTGQRISIFDFNCNGDIHRSLFEGQCYVVNNSTIIQKSKVIEIGGLDEDCPSMQEWDTHIRLSKIVSYETIPEVLTNYYVGSEDAISSDKKREVIGRLYILKKHKKEWVSYRRAGVNFFKQIKKYIAVVDDESFRKQANKNLVRIVPIIYVLYILNKPFEYIIFQVRRVIDHFKYIRSIKKNG